MPTPPIAHVALVAALLLGACSGDEPRATGPDATAESSTSSSTSTTSAAGEVSSGWRTFRAFADDCAGIDDAPAMDTAQITFVRDDRLYAVDPTTAGTEAPCLLDATGPSLLWGPDATKVLLADAVVTSGGRDALPGLATGAAFSRPSGTSTIGVDDGRLIKTNIASGEATDISFLARHDAVTYHPAGTHVIVAGEDDAGTDGLWLATNVGTDPRLLAESPDTTFSHLSITENGTRLVFVADHGTDRHVHRAWLQGAALSLGSDERQAETILSFTDEIVSLAVDSSGEVAVGHGTCADGRYATALFATGRIGEPTRGDDVEPAREDIGWPIGYLPDGSLVFARNDDGCFEPGEPFDVMLRRADPRIADVLIVSDVTAASVRMAAGQPPEPPTDNLSGFA